MSIWRMVPVGFVLAAGCLGEASIREQDAATSSVWALPNVGDAALDAQSTVDLALPAEQPDATMAPGYLFSESFENGLDASAWTTTRQGGTVVVDSIHVSAGNRALHAHVQNTGQNTAFANTTQRFALDGEDTFIRAFIYIETPLANHAQIFRLWSSWANGYDLEVLSNSTGGINFFETWYYEHTSSDPNAQQYTSSAAPTGSWHCWEWEVNGSTDELQLWLDGTQVKDATVLPSAKWLAPADAPLSLGWADFHDEPGTPQGFDVWIDDVVVSRARIGCGHLD